MITSKKHTFIILLILILSIQGFTQKDKNVVIHMKDFQVTKSQIFDLLVRRYPRETNEVIRELVVRHIIRKQVEKEKINVSRQEVIKQVLKEIKKTKQKVKNELGKTWSSYLKEQGVTERDLKRNLFVKWRYSLSVQQLIRLFELRQKHIDARHIMVENKKEALEIIKKLKNGADFSTLAQQKSKALTTRANGGRLPTAFKGELPPEIEKIIWNLSKKLLNSPISSANAFHVVEILKVNNGTPNASWKSQKQNIAKSIQEKPISPRDFGRWLNYMKKAYKIKHKLE